MSFSLRLLPTSLLRVGHGDNKYSFNSISVKFY